MSQEPEKRGFLFENLVLAWSKLGKVRKIIERLTSRRVYKNLPEAIKDDIKEIKEEVKVRKEE